MRWPVVVVQSASGPRLRRLRRARKPTASKELPVDDQGRQQLAEVGRWSPGADLRSALELLPMNDEMLMMIKGCPNSLINIQCSTLSRQPSRVFSCFLLPRLIIICRVVWCGSDFDSESESHVVVKTLTCGYAVKCVDWFIRVSHKAAQGNEPTFLSSTVRM